MTVYIKVLLIIVMLAAFLMISLFGLMEGFVNPIRSGHLPLYQLAEALGMSEVTCLTIFGVISLLFLPIWIMFVQAEIIPKKPDTTKGVKNDDNTS